MYEQLVIALKVAGVLGDNVLIAHDSTAKQASPARSKIIGGIYHKGSPPTIHNHVDWSWIELSVMCSGSSSLDDPFDFDDRATHQPYRDRRGDNSLPRIMRHPTLAFERQQRTHYYTVVIFGTYARIVRWDRSGAVFSSKFDYQKEPAKLGLFLWRFCHSSASVRGHDPTACRVLPGSEHHKFMVQRAAHKLSAEREHARELFAESLVDDWPWWKLRVDDTSNGKPREFLVGRPTYVAPDMVGSGTRGYVALDLTDPQHAFVFLKDCWRVVDPRREQEGAILAYLNSKEVECIPTMLCHGDVDERCTESQHVQGGRCRAMGDWPGKARIHYRLVVREVGLPLVRLQTGMELVRMFILILCAHQDAYEKAKIIHRDISVGNIVLIPRIGADGETVYKALLIDWASSKRLDQDDPGPRQPEQAGTLQYMSVDAQDHPGKDVTVADELESMLHTMIWCAIRYLPHNHPDVSYFMHSHFQDFEDTPTTHASSAAKSSAVRYGCLETIGGGRLAFLREAPCHDGGTDLGSRLPWGKVDVPRTYTKEQRHPINGIFRDILRWFSAYYTPPSPESTPTKRYSTTVIESGVDADLSRYFAAKASQRRSEPRASRRDDSSYYKELADNLKTHYAFGQVLTSYFLGMTWPENDKQDDQLRSSCPEPSEGQEDEESADEDG
ncbi:hypothetical protein OH77DRAFT_1420159 [Trametes cingulata]|nr:hypothetical protein OH77DRAFT_1420159 [Trametes cingulata]